MSLDLQNRQSIVGELTFKAVDETATFEVSVYDGTDWHVCANLPLWVDSTEEHDNVLANVLEENAAFTEYLTKMFQTVEDINEQEYARKAYDDAKKVLGE